MADKLFKRIGTLFFTVLLTIAAANLAPAQDDDDEEGCPSAIGKAKIFEALKSREIGQKEIAAIVKECGVDFRVTAETRRELIAAGASEAVVEAVESSYRGVKQAGESSENGAAAAKASYERGNKLFEEKKYAEAILAYRESLREFPNIPGAHAGIGMSYLLMKQWGEAEQNLQRAIELFPANTPAYTEAVAELQTALKFVREQMTSGQRQASPAVNPQAEQLMKQGSEFFAAKQWKKAAKSWEQAAKLDPRNPTAFYNLGSAYFNSGQYTKSRNAYRKVLELNPNHPKAGKDLADAEAAIAEEKAKQNEFFENLGKASRGVADALDEGHRTGSGGGGSGTSTPTSSSGRSSSGASSPGASSPPVGKYACYNYSMHFMYNLTILDGSNYGEGRYQYNSATGAINWLSGDLADRDYYIGGYAFTNNEGKPQINIKLNSSRDSEYYCYKQ